MADLKNVVGSAPYRDAWLDFQRRDKRAKRMIAWVYALMFSLVFVHKIRWASWAVALTIAGLIVAAATTARLRCPRCRNPWPFAHKRRGLPIPRSELEATQCEKCGLKWENDSDE